MLDNIIRTSLDTYLWSNFHNKLTQDNQPTQPSLTSQNHRQQASHNRAAQETNHNYCYTDPTNMNEDILETL